MVTAKMAIQYGALDTDGGVFCCRQCLLIVTVLNLLWLEMHCGWQWPSMDTLYDLLSLPMAIHGQASQSMVADSGHRWIRFTTYCGEQYINRSIVPPVYCSDNIDRFPPRLLLSTIPINRFVRRPLSLTMLIDTFHSLLPITKPIDRHLPQAIAANNIYR